MQPSVFPLMGRLPAATKHDESGDPAGVVDTAGRHGGSMQPSSCRCYNCCFCCYGGVEVEDSRGI